MCYNRKYGLVDPNTICQYFYVTGLTGAVLLIPSHISKNEIIRSAVHHPSGQVIFSASVAD